jgi:predicted dehydrogenase
MSERIGVALIGAGRIGLVHLNNILANQRFDLLYVVDAVEALLRLLLPNQHTPKQF